MAGPAKLTDMWHPDQPTNVLTANNMAIPTYDANNHLSATYVQNLTPPPPTHADHVPA
jgi:hypothetical protein